MKCCRNCHNYVWGDWKTPVPDKCVECEHIKENGKKIPSNWTPKHNPKGAKMQQTAEVLAATPKITVSCEDQNTVYATFPDGLRLIFRNGEYAGWYLPGKEQ